MAKKQTASGEAKEKETKEKSPGKGALDAAAGEAPAPKKERKPREPKEKKTSPEAPAPEGAGAAAPAEEKAPAPKTAAPAAEGEKKRKKQPGHPPVRGKKLRAQMRAMREKLAQEGVVPLKRAVSFLKQNKRAKFDETVEIHMALGVDTTQNDQMVRGSVPLPHGIGKAVRVLVFAQGDDVAKAKEAGADHAGSDDIIKKIQQEGWLEFDVALATQGMMGQVSRLGKVLGPRGLMPTPKAGTVITAGGDVAAAVREFKAGKVEFRADKGGNVHAGVGKLSFEDDKLVANVTAFVDQIRAAKPSGVKGNYIKSITLSATMSPGVPVTV